MTTTLDPQQARSRGTRRRATIAAVVAGSALVLGSSAFAAYALGSSSHHSIPVAAAPAAPSTSPASQASQQPVKITINNPAPATPKPAKTVYMPAAPAAPALRYVANGIYANSATSDAFALAVVNSFPGYPGVAYVYSPVTGQSYAMTYQILGAGTVIATGGNNAYVQF